MALLVDLFVILEEFRQKNRWLRNSSRISIEIPPKKAASFVYTNNFNNNIFTVIPVFTSSVKNSFSVVVLAPSSESVSGFKIFTV